MMSCFIGYLHLLAYHASDINTASYLRLRTDFAEEFVLLKGDQAPPSTCYENCPF